MHSDLRRHAQAAHAMQSGVAVEMGIDSAPTSPKHLRVGVNAAMADHAGLVRLLIKKGLITEEEYYGSIADSMEAEKTRYEEHLTKQLGRPVVLH